MLRLLLATVLPATVPCLLLLLPARPAGRDTEPPLRFEVELDGVKYAVDAGNKIDVEVGGNKVAMTVTVKPTRRFATAGIAFDYPSGMSYSFDGDGGLDMWTLDGEACMIMVQQFDLGGAEDLASTVLEEILAGEDGKAEKPESLDLQFGSKKCKAMRGTIVHDDYTETWIAVGIDTNKQAVVLLLQEVVDEDGSSAREMHRLLDLFAQTFAVTR